MYACYSKLPQAIYIYIYVYIYIYICVYIYIYIHINDPGSRFADPLQWYPPPKPNLCDCAHHEGPKTVICHEDRVP